MKWIISYLYTIFYLSSNTTTWGHVDTKCTGEMLELSCRMDHLIVVKTIYFGKSRTCTHGPWPPGCMQENHHFHPCTGLRLCAVKAPSIEIKGCGFNDYVHVEYDCIEASAIEDICKADRKKNILRNKQGYIATPGYPTKLTMQGDTPSCVAHILVEKPPNSVLNVYILDSFSIAPSTDSKQCGIHLKLTQSVIKRNTDHKQRSLAPLKGKGICLERTLHRKDLLYSSEGEHLRVQFSVSKDRLESTQRKGMLLYYEVETIEIIEIERTTTVMRINFPEKPEESLKHSVTTMSTTEPVRELATDKPLDIEETTSKGRGNMELVTGKTLKMEDLDLRGGTNKKLVTEITSRMIENKELVTEINPRMIESNLMDGFNTDELVTSRMIESNLLHGFNTKELVTEKPSRIIESNLLDGLNTQVSATEKPPRMIETNPMDRLNTKELVTEITPRMKESMDWVNTEFVRETTLRMEISNPTDKVNIEEVTNKLLQIEDKVMGTNIDGIGTNKTIRHGKTGVTERVDISLIQTNKTTSVNGYINVEEMENMNETVDILLQEDGSVNSTHLSHRHFLGVQIGGGVGILAAAAVTAFLVYYFYRRHQRKVTFYRNRLRYRPRIQHKIFTTDTFPTEILPKVSSYDNPAFLYDSSKSHMNGPSEDHENPYEVPISTVQDVSLKLSQSEEISIGNDFLSVKERKSKRRATTAVCEPYATAVIESKMLHENTMNENNQNHNLRKQKSHPNGGPKTVIYANGVRLSPQKKTDNKTQIKFGNPTDTKDNHINNWVKDQVKHTTYLTTIKEELQNHELLHKNVKKQNTRNSGVTGDRQTDFTSELEERVKDYLEPDSGFSDISEVKSNMEHNTIRQKSKPMLTGNSKMEESEQDEEDLNISMTTEPDDVPSDGPNNLKRFQIRKSSKRKFSNLQYAQLDHIRGKGLSLPPKSNLKPENQVVYSSIDFKKSIELHEKAIQKHKKNKMLLAASECADATNETSEPIKSQDGVENESGDEQDWTIQIQLMMSNVPKGTGTTVPKNPNSGERGSTSSRGNSYSESNGASTVGGSLSTFSKPAPKPKPRMAVAPKPILKKGNRDIYLSDTDLSQF